MFELWNSKVKTDNWRYIWWLNPSLTIGTICEAQQRTSLGLIDPSGGHLTPHHNPPLLTSPRNHKIGIHLTTWNSKTGGNTMSSLAKDVCTNVTFLDDGIGWWWMGMWLPLFARINRRDAECCPDATATQVATSPVRRGIYYLQY